MTEEKKETKISPWPWSVGVASQSIDSHGETFSCDAPIIMDANDECICLIEAAILEDPKTLRFAGWDASRCKGDACLMSAAPELREELEKLVKRSCSMCAAEMKAAITPQNKPCEDGRPCPYGLDGAKKAIGKSYGKGD